MPMRAAAELPPDVREATTRHVAALKALEPELLSGLYVTGSVALGDYQPGRSDIDFMAFLSRPVGDADVVAALQKVHDSLDLDLDYDGKYVEAAQLPDVPDDERVAPHVVGGKFHDAEPSHGLTPATLAEFARYAITVRGPNASDLGVSVAPARLNEWLVQNLNSYWKKGAEEGIDILRSRGEDATIAAQSVVWVATGAARLHYTLATGGFASKSAAGSYAISLFPEYHDIVSAAVAWRATGQGEFTNADWISCGELTVKIVADANNRWGSD